MAQPSPHALPLQNGEGKIAPAQFGGQDKHVHIHAEALHNGTGNIMTSHVSSQKESPPMMPKTIDTKVQDQIFDHIKRLELMEQPALLEKGPETPGPDHDMPGNVYCMTQEGSASNFNDVRAGCFDPSLNECVVPRWLGNREIKWALDAESFASPAKATIAELNLNRATSHWNGRGIPVTFRQCEPDEPHTFLLRYVKSLDDAIARGFFPNDPVRVLYITRLGFKQKFHDKMYNIFLHEIGHIMGLRHEFAATKEKSNPSAEVSPPDDLSVMNYFPGSFNFEVQDSDVEGLRALYRLREGSWFKGFKVVIVDPAVYLPAVRRVAMGPVSEYRKERDYQFDRGCFPNFLWAIRMAVAVPKRLDSLEVE